MGIKVSYYYFGNRREGDLAKAIRNLLTHSPYSTMGPLGMTQEQADQNSEIIGRLIAKLVQKGILDENDLTDLFGYKMNGPIKIMEE